MSATATHPKALVTHQDDRVEGALWTAVRALEERAELRRRLSSQTEAAGLAAVAETLAKQAQAAEQQANDIRDLLARSGGRVSSPMDEQLAEGRRKQPRQR
jgi:two-component system, chemotaxis family, protein-glutamate methylesterase/glutaminase